jgi:cytochrome d ubiquinol oxidase subunit II
MIFTLPHLVAGTMVLAITVYVFLGGADFGGGLWDLFATGPRHHQQREVIAHAIGPVWEANHVWLILVVVMLFSCFPAAFAHVSTELHIPLTLMLVGVVLRGSAFTFRSYNPRESGLQRGFGLTFSIASLVTPVLLGICIGTVAAGNIPMSAVPAGVTFAGRFVAPWATLFALSVGLLMLALCALLAATYLTVEAQDDELRDDFRARALAACAAVVITATVTALLAERDAPLVYHALTSGVRAVTLLATTALLGALLVWALYRRHFYFARIAAAAVAAFIVWGWAWSQYPFMIPPDRTIDSLAAPHSTLVWTMVVLSAGTVILLPSFLYLFRVFKGAESPLEESELNVKPMIASPDARA